MKRAKAVRPATSRGWIAPGETARVTIVGVDPLGAAAEAIDEHHASSDESTCADADALTYDGTRADVSGFTNRDVSAKNGSSGDVAMRADDAVMLDDGGGIHEHVIAELGIRVDDGFGQDLAARATHGGGRDVSSGMDDALRLQTSFQRGSEEPGTQRAALRGTDADGEVSKAEGGKLWELFITTDDGYTGHFEKTGL